VHVGRDLGGEHVVGGLGQDPGHVQRHVAGADHADLGGRQRPVARHIRMTVVPLHELGGAVAAGQGNAGDNQLPVPLAVGRHDHRVVVAAQVGEREVPAVGDVAEQPQAGLVEHSAQRVHDLLDPGVVRGHLT
jgi:hypothetical protein